jgi:hypothetical protein
VARKTTLVVALALIPIGVLALLRAVGVISFSVGGLVGGLVLVAIGAAILWGMLAKPDLRPIEAEEASVPLAGATGASVRVSHGAGRLSVGGGAPADQLLEGSFEGGVDARIARTSDKIDVQLRLPDGLLPLVVSRVNWSRGRGLDWRFGLSPKIPLSLRFDAGAADLRLDLTDLKVTDVRISTGASSTVLTLPAGAGQTRVDVESGAASIKIRVPEGVAARIRVSGGLSSTSVDRARFPRRAGVYESPDYDTAENRADIRVSSGLGSVVVR